MARTNPTTKAKAAAPAAPAAPAVPDAPLEDEQPAELTCNRAGVFLQRPDGTIVVPIAVHGDGIRCVVLDRTDVLSPAELDALDEL
mgnify:CR=1 FL=1